MLPSWVIESITSRKQFLKMLSYKLNSIFNQNTNGIWQATVKKYMVEKKTRQLDLPGEEVRK